MVADRGCAVQVVNVVGPNSYSLNEQALGVFLEGGIQGLPVAVVSVSGAFRGGKSFLLDFCLRYLNATDEERRCNTWLGRDADPLVGFGWRTGVERNTIGIHIWSRPFVMTLPSGDKVAVVLMDTQGLYDNETTTSESATIFALSMLMSSMQVFNLSGNLKSDDLQHLQLFTEYARLGLSDSEQPFQSLLFLVRDWQFTTSEPYGVKGGGGLLERVLQVKSEQPAQQKEIRQHLRSCFEQIDCFLMAHPGFSVSDANFRGYLKDIRSEFKSCLLELVPFLLSPERLVPKRINGQRITAKEFVFYFKTYLDLVNSGQLPTPATMLQATSQAGIFLAVEAARAAYAGGTAACAGARVLPRAALYRLHAAAVAAARDLFVSRRIMGSRKKIDEALTQVTQEFDKRLEEIVALNEAKLRKSHEDALNTYVNHVLGSTPEHLICISPGALASAHAEAVGLALAEFKEKLHIDGEDTETPQLLKDLNARYAQIVQFNNLNNEKALSQSLQIYSSEMDRCTNGGSPCISASQLQSKHQLARQAGSNFMKSQRNRVTDDEDSDSYFERLYKEMDAQYNKFMQLNNANCESTEVAVVAFYKDKMSELFGKDIKCLPPSELTNGEADVRERALQMYHSRRSGDGDDKKDNLLAKILASIEKHFKQVVARNVGLNNSAIESACAKYRECMDASINLPAILRPLTPVIAPIRVVKLFCEVGGYHEKAKRKALDVFKSYRRNGGVETNDSFYKSLIKEIDRQYGRYRCPLIVVARELGMGVECPF